MRRCYAGFSSLTLALRGKEVLDANAITSEVVKKDPKKSRRGCAFALEFSCAHRRSCEALFRRYGVSYLGTVEE